MKKANIVNKQQECLIQIEKALKEHNQLIKEQNAILRQIGENIKWLR